MSMLQELLTEEIRDLYDAEKQLVKALPKMAKAAQNPNLKKVLEDHLETTRGQVERLEQIFALMDERPRSKPCKGMKGLIEEGQEVMSEHSGDEALDSAMIGAAQKVEHYEISGYGTARTLAETLGMKKAAQLLQKTLREEEDADQKLTRVALKILKETDTSEPARMPAKRGQTGGNGSKARQADGRQGRGAASRSRSGAGSQMTTDHEEIRQWAEARGAEPACVRGTGGKSDAGVLRFDFPGYSGRESLEHISWDEFFEKFDESNLALLYQGKTAGGKTSNFNKLVAR